MSQMATKLCEKCGSSDLPENNTACAMGDCAACSDCVCADCDKCYFKHCRCDSDLEEESSE